MQEIVKDTDIAEMSSEYIVLRYEKGRFLNVLPHGRAHRFIEYPEHVTYQDDDELYSNWIIKASILLIKFLHLIEKPMSWLGCCIEFILNLLLPNEGLFGGPNIVLANLFCL